MSKIELDNIASGYNLGKINANFVKIEEALDNKVLFRDNTATPTEPNQMEQAIDMNGNSLLNLPTPTAPTNPVRLQDLGDYATSTELTEVDNRLTAADVTLQNNIDTANSLRITGDNVLTTSVNGLDGRVTTLETGTAGDSRYIHWLYNDGSATGGETTINIPYDFTSVATVFINGVRMTYGLAFEYDVTAKTVTFAEALDITDEVVVSLGTEPVQDYSDLVTDVQLAEIQDITKPYIFDNVSGMVNSTIVFPIGKTLETSGYHTKGDAGKAKYLIVTAQTADGYGDHTLANGNVAVIQTNGKIDVKQYGAKSDGVTNDTLAMQAAHNVGRVVKYTAGTYLFDKITMLSGGIEGESVGVVDDVVGGVVLKTTSTNNDDIITWTGNVLSANAPIFRDFAIKSTPLAKAGGYAIAFKPDNVATARTDHAVISNVLVRYIPSGFDMSDSTGWTIEKCNVYFYSDKGVRVANALFGDVGDSSIYGCTFFNGGAGSTYGGVGYAIWQESSGGLRIENNKFNGGAGHYLLDVQAVTSVLPIIGNSFENCTATSLNFNNSTSTALVPLRFSHITITANEFSGNVTDISFNAINEYLNSSYWDNVIISANVFYYRDALNSISFNTMRHFNISGNVWNGNNEGNRGILISSTCANGRIGVNTYNGLTTPILNQSATTLIDFDTVTGSDANTAPATANYGALFMIEKAVIFDDVFYSAPEVTVNVNQVNGSLCGHARSVTTSGFTAVLISATANANVQFDYIALGLSKTT